MKEFDAIWPRDYEQGKAPRPVDSSTANTCLLQQYDSSGRYLILLPVQNIGSLCSRCLRTTTYKAPYCPHTGASFAAKALTNEFIEPVDV